MMILSARRCSTSVALTEAPDTSGVPADTVAPSPSISTSPSSIVAPGSPASFSTAMTSSLATLYCLPPVRITANMMETDIGWRASRRNSVKDRLRAFREARTIVMHPRLSTISGFRMDHTAASPDRQDAADDLFDTGRFGTVRVVARDCPLCDGGDAAPLTGYGHDIWRLVSCRGCGFVYLDRSPDYSALLDAMAWEKTGAAELERRAEIRPISFRLSRATRIRMALLPRKRMADLVARVARPGNVIDLGCGTGGQLAQLPPTFVPYGVEISAAAAKAADAAFRRRGGAAINQPSLTGL